MKEIYLDNSATTPICRESTLAMQEVYRETYGNPSSLHRLGLKAEKKMQESRSILAGILKVDPGEIYFTSGGTEASNLAIKGIARRHARRGKHIITTGMEHPATLLACKSLEKEGFAVDYLEVGPEGDLPLKALQERVGRDTILVSVMHVNNEIGSILSVAEIGKLIKEKNPTALFHVDAVQSFCKLPCLPRRWQADLVSISAHKIHGPKGVGALYKREGIHIEPLFHGGGQEKGIRPGTENPAGVAGFAAAAAHLAPLREENHRHMQHLKDVFTEGVLGEISRTRVNGPREGAPHILNISFTGVRGEVLLHTLEDAGIYVSTGSACHSRSQEPSHVLKALKLADEDITGALRFSFSPFNTLEEIHICIETLITAVRELRQML